MEETVAALEAAGADRHALLIDVWNEPNFLNDTQWAQFLGAWRRAHTVVRGRFRLVGPSVASAYYKGRLAAFLDYVSEHDCAPSVVSWHELGDTSGRFLPIKVAQIRKMLLNRSIDAPISINEIVPSTNVLYPGTLLSYFTGLELAGVSSAAHSCWGDCGGANCPLSHLDGLLTCGGAPRPVWWVYRWYARLRGGARVIGSSNISSPYRSADALGAVWGQRMEVLVGFFGFPGDTQASVSGSVSVVGIPRTWEMDKSDARVWLTIESVPFNAPNTSSLAAPNLLYNGTCMLGPNSLSKQTGKSPDVLISSWRTDTTRRSGFQVRIPARWQVHVQDVLRFVIHPHTAAAMRDAVRSMRGSYGITDDE